MRFYLPYSGRRFWFDKKDTFLCSTGPVPIRNNTVKISWIFGYKEYCVDFLLVVTKIPNNLPTHLWDRILPLNGVDKNGKKVLGYRFDKPVESEEYPGYYFIPYYTTYGIDRKKNIINLTTGKNKSFYRTKPNEERNSTGGYYVTRVKDDLGKSRGLMRHRAVCLAFKAYDVPPELLVVNHRDGIPGNDEESNLQWCTYLENNLHAIGNGLTPNRLTPVLLKNVDTGKVERFISIKACSEFFDGIVPATTIQFRAAKRSKYLLEGKWLVKYDDGTPWRTDYRKMHYLDGVDIVGRNVFTGEVIFASDCGIMSDMTDVRRATILRHLREDVLVPVSGWNFRYLIDGATWPVHTERHLEVYRASPKNPKDGCIVVDSEGKETFFTSFRKASDALGLRIGRLFEAASSGKRIERGYTVKRFNIRKTIRSTPLVT